MNHLDTLRDNLKSFSVIIKLVKYIVFYNNNHELVLSRLRVPPSHYINFLSVHVPLVV